MEKSIRDYITRKMGQATNQIALIVLIVFCGLLSVVLIKTLSIYSCTNSDCVTEHGEVWLEVFKNGFLLLGGALTTLIGYYFGNRGSEQALTNAERLSKEAEAMLEELSKQAPTESEDENDIQPIT